MLIFSGIRRGSRWAKAKVSGPGDEIDDSAAMELADEELARGFLLGERIIERSEQILAIRHCTTVDVPEADRLRERVDHGARPGGIR